MKADEKTTAGVLPTLNQWSESYAARDLDRAMAVFAPDPDAIFIGTGADEKRVGLSEMRAQVARDWSQSEAMSLELGWSSVSAAGSVAWLAGDVIIRGKVEGQEMHLPARITAVLEQRGDTWLLLQCHVSLPAAEQAAGESWPA